MMDKGEHPARRAARAKALPSAEQVTWVRDRLLEWFAVHARQLPWRGDEYDAYQLVVAEVLLQRTRAEVVAAFIDHFFQRFPSWQALADAPEEEIGSFLKPIGLWRRRASGLKRLATEMARRGGEFPSEREELERIPSVGQYIANAILLLLHGRPEPLLDVNMARVIERFFGTRGLADIRHDPYLQKIARELVAKDPRQVNWAVLDFAAKVCRAPRPLCHACPLRERCAYANQADLGSAPPGSTYHA
jgi:A/G-specific adenine glycosylase